MKVKYPQLDVEFPSSKTATSREIERFLLSVLYIGAGKANPRVSGRSLLAGASCTSLYGIRQKNPQICLQEP